MTTLCAQEHGFNLQAATRVAANDKQGRLTLCRYLLRPPLANDRLPKNTSRYIRWSDLLRRVFGFEILCSKCQAPLRLIALIKAEDAAKKILTAMHLPTEIPELHPARPPPRQPESGEDWVN